MKRKKEVATWKDAIKWCIKHSYKGMSFMYVIKNEDTDEMFGRMYVDTDGIIKLKEVNKMKDWLVVHDMSDGIVMIKKESIEFISKSSDGSTYLSTRSGSLCVREKYNDIVRRIIE